MNRAPRQLCSSGRSDDGFTLIEVIIAVVIIIIVAASATVVLSSGSRVSSRTKVVDRQHAIASGVLARAMANTSWIDTYGCRSVGPCAGAATNFVPDSHILLNEREGTVTHQVRFIANGVDLPSDGTGTGDVDGQLPDVFRLQVIVHTEVPASLGGTLKDFAVSGNLDMAVRAKTGVLALRTCSITQQVDERVGTGQCAESTTAGAASGAFTRTVNIAPPGNGVAGYCTTGATESPECAAWRSALANPTYATAASRVRIATLGLSFRLTGPLPMKTDTFTITTSAAGNGRLEGLEPGQYKIELSAADATRWQRWGTHSVPSGGYVTIQAGEVSNAVQLFHPVPRNPVTVRLTTLNDTIPGSPVVTAGAWIRRAIKLVPAPAGRSPLASGEALGWSRIEVGMTDVTLVGATPGLYEAQFLEFPGSLRVRPYTTVTPAPQFIWIPGVGGTPATQFPTTLELQDYRCDAAARIAWIVANAPASDVALRKHTNAQYGFWWNRGTPTNLADDIHVTRCPTANPSSEPGAVTGTPGA